MLEGQVLEFSGVTKRFGAVTAVDGFTARVEPGQVTGFLGPNGAGKTTTLRILLGLVRSTEGTATIGGVPYAKLSQPLRGVGAVLEASSFHPGRTAANHLKVYAQAAGLPKSRVDEALALVGLGDVAGRKVGGYSLGMRQRLGLAYALIGDPGVLVLDEPANGLDPEGIKWMRGLLRDLARQGRTVLVSSHLLAEVQQTVDSLLIISAGRLVFQGGLEDLSDPSEFATIVDATDRAALSAALRAQGVDFEVLRSGLTVRGLDPAAVGVIAAEARVPLSSLQRRGPALEEVFLDLVNGSRVHSSAGPAGAATAVGDAGAAGAVVPGAGDEAADDGAAVAGAAVLAANADETDAVADATVDDQAKTAHAESEAVPTGDERTARESDEPESADDAADDVTETDREESDPSAPAPAESAADEPDATLAEPDDEVGTTPVDDVPVDDGRAWEAYVKTEADREADRFFASFGGERDGDGARGDGPAENPEGTEEGDAR
jgi:ABC-2 type transport system ATP-binding protein